MEMFYMLVGVLAIYTPIHFFVVQFNTPYKDRTSYQKVLTWATLGFVTLVYLAIMDL